MSMSKKDFIALADHLRHLDLDADENCRVALADVHNLLADFCKSQNSAFMRDRWLSYLAGTCGPNGGSK